MTVHQPSRLLSLPDELLDSILIHVPLDTFLACQLTCKRLYALSTESLLWRRQYLSQYRYWRPESGIAQLTQAPPASVNWKKLLVERKHIDQNITRSLDSIIGSQSNRIKKIEETLQHGYDAKDILLKHLDIDDSVDDVLARRYWTSEALGCLERAAGLSEWAKLDAGEDVPLERALGAFDLMIAQRPPETLDQISNHLDLLAEQFKAETPEHDDMLPGPKARMLATFLVAKRITSGNLSGGGQTEHAFRRLQNTLISITLCDENHPSIPIISVAIFCCVARRLGLDAHPCAYPVRVLATVFIPRDDNGIVSDNTSFTPMYMDVYSNVAVIPLANLRQQLFTWGIPPEQHSEFLRPATTSQIIERNARNIQESLTSNQTHDFALNHASSDALRLLAPHTDDSDHDPTSLRTALNPDRALYAIGWYNIFSAAHRTHDNVRMVTLTHLASALTENFRYDVSQFQRFALPLFGTEGGGAARATFIATQLQVMRDEDAQIPAVQSRDYASGDADPVKYHIGQVFRHRRYGYTGVITGWDTRCKASDRWMLNMNVDSLPGGRDQCFYHVLVDDDSSRYVAEENIEIENHPLGIKRNEGLQPPVGLLRLAGKYFKRWDTKRNEFVSNLRDQYPDD